MQEVRLIHTCIFSRHKCYEVFLMFRFLFRSLFDICSCSYNYAFEIVQHSWIQTITCILKPRTHVSDMCVILRKKLSWVDFMYVTTEQMLHDTSNNCMC